MRVLTHKPWRPMARVGRLPSVMMARRRYTALAKDWLHWIPRRRWRFSQEGLALMIGSTSFSAALRKPARRSTIMREESC